MTEQRKPRRLPRRRAGTPVAMWRQLLAGAAAGAAGTTALNAATYVDMALRGRPASSTPERSVEAITDRAGLSVPGDGAERRRVFQFLCECRR